MAWKIDYEKVAFAPDFSKGSLGYDLGTVEQSYPRPSVVEVRNAGPRAPSFVSIGLTAKLAGEMKIEEGNAALATDFYSPNQPAIFIGVLSSNQRTPVFVLGFRIVDQVETNQAATR